jgi:hypothetical protein
MVRYGTIRYGTVAYIVQYTMLDAVIKEGVKRREDVSSRQVSARDAAIEAVAKSAEIRQELAR